MEDIPLPENMLDVIISNGAFCLAPNKEKAFGEIYRVLKPGGRMAVCTSTVKAELKPGVNWPMCMQMFTHISAIEPLCSKIGFQNISVDDSNALMQFDLPGDDKDNKETNADKKKEEDGNQITEKKADDKTDAAKRAKSQVHVGSSEFKHLENYDMNDLCARVIIYGTKPVAE